MAMTVPIGLTGAGDEDDMPAGAAAAGEQWTADFDVGLVGEVVGEGGMRAGADDDTAAAAASAFPASADDAFARMAAAAVGGTAGDASGGFASTGSDSFHVGGAPDATAASTAAAATTTGDSGWPVVASAAVASAAVAVPGSQQARPDGKFAVGRGEAGGAQVQQGGSQEVERLPDSDAYLSVLESKLDRLRRQRLGPGGGHGGWSQQQSRPTGRSLRSDRKEGKQMVKWLAEAGKDLLDAMVDDGSRADGRASLAEYLREGRDEDEQQLAEDGGTFDGYAQHGAQAAGGGSAGGDEEDLEPILQTDEGPHVSADVNRSKARAVASASSRFFGIMGGDDSDGVSADSDSQGEDEVDPLAASGSRGRRRHGRGSGRPRRLVERGSIWTRLCPSCCLS